MRHIKVAVTGAAGQIGYALIFRIASGAMFGANTCVDLHLIELPHGRQALEGLKMELQDCAFPLLKNIVCTDDLQEGFDGIDWALLVGSAPRKAGMERADLLAINGGIFKTQGLMLNQHASANAKVLVIGNPCNTNAMIAMHHAPNLKPENFYALTMLDENRARAQLALKAGVGVEAVERMIIWGNHSATQFPDFANATLGGRPATEVIDDLDWLKSTFIPTVQKRGAQVIEARGASSAASAANAVVDCVGCLDGQRIGFFSMGVASQGQYGAEEGLIVSYPCAYHPRGLRIQDDWQHDAFAEELLAKSFAELADERRTVAELGLL